MKRKFRFLRASLLAPLPVMAVLLGSVFYVMHDPASDKASLQTVQLLLKVAPVLYGLMVVAGYIGTRLLALFRGLSLVVLLVLAVATGGLFGGAAALSGSLGHTDAVVTFAVLGGVAAVALVLCSLLWWWIATRGQVASPEVQGSVGS